MTTSAAASAALEFLLARLRPHFTGLALSSALSVGVNLIARAPKDTRRMVAGTPLYIYAVAIIFQLIVLPPLTYTAWSRKGFTTEWLGASWTTFGPSREKAWRHGLTL